jgi:tetratricopeptide (TPR) repeat protein
MEEYEKGIRLFQQKDYAKAIPRFQAIIDQFKDEPSVGDRARMYLRICTQAGQDRKPLRQTRSPEQAEEVGVYLLNLGEFKEAVRHLEKALERDGNDPHAHVTLAAAQLGAGDKDGAMGSLRRAVELDPRARVWVQAISDFDDLEDEQAFLDLMHGD